MQKRNSYHGQALPRRRTDQLRKGRVSEPHMQYFLTLRAEPGNGLARDQKAEAITCLINKMFESRDWILEAGTVMPDHVHLLVQLGERLSLSQCVAKFKSLTRRNHCSWQANFYEHRLRENETPEGFALYIFLNPYRAGLLKRDEVWPYWMRGDGVEFDFEAHLENGRYPLVEWLTDPWDKLGVSEVLVRE